jgi:ferritin-like metal-binding protein YciE
MAQEATDQNLRDSLRGHIDQTEQQIRNLEQVYGQLGQEPQRLTSEGAQGLVSEAQQSIREARGEATRDCAINAAIVRVEHFEMGTYRGMVTGAQQMGRDEVVDLLQQNLNQEEETAQIAQQRGPDWFGEPCRIPGYIPPGTPS